MMEKETCTIVLSGNTYDIDEVYKVLEQSAAKHNVAIKEETRTVYGEIKVAANTIKKYFHQIGYDKHSRLYGCTSKKVFDMLHGETRIREGEFEGISWRDHEKELGFGMEVIYTEHPQKEEKLA